MRILFLHGWTSVPGGLKPTFLKDHGLTVLNPALPDEDFEEAVRIAQTEFDSGEPDVIVGSSTWRAVLEGDPRSQAAADVQGREVLDDSGHG